MRILGQIVFVHTMSKHASRVSMIHIAVNNYHVAVGYSFNIELSHPDALE